MPTQETQHPSISQQSYYFWHWLGSVDNTRLTPGENVTEASLIQTARVPMNSSFNIAYSQMWSFSTSLAHPDWRGERRTVQHSSVELAFLYQVRRKASRPTWLGQMQVRHDSRDLHGAWEQTLKSSSGFANQPSNYKCVVTHNFSVSRIQNTNNKMLPDVNMRKN